MQPAKGDLWNALDNFVCMEELFGLLRGINRGESMTNLVRSSVFNAIYAAQILTIGQLMRV